MEKMKEINIFSRKTIGNLKRKLKKLKSLYSSRLSIKEQTFLIKRLSFLIKAGIPLLDSLHMIKEETRSKNQIVILNTVISDVSNGQHLSKSLSKYRKMFGDFSINIISVGESSGILSANLEYLAEELRKKQALKKKIIGALIYPFVVTLATLGITAFLLIYLFPKIMPVFVSLHMVLPLSTRIVIFLSNFITHYGIYLILGVVFIVTIFLIALKKSKQMHFYFDKFILKMPIVGKTIKNYNLASTTRTMGLLLKGGITLSEALPITAKTNNNSVYKEEFRHIGSIVNRGEKISAYLKKKRDLFPDVASQIISVGERSGNLSNSLIYLSELYESEVDDFTKNLSNLIEPILMVFMGILVGFIAISIITPIYSITTHISTR